jgi:hypothetical protein
MEFHKILFQGGAGPQSANPHDEYYDDEEEDDDMNFEPQNGYGDDDDDYEEQPEVEIKKKKKERYARFQRNRGQCYNHDSTRFSQISGKKLANF